MPDTHFVIVHGLASKPPEAVLAERYHRFLQESVRKPIATDRCHTVYWADLMGYVPPDGPEKDEFSDEGPNFEPYSFIEQFRFFLRGSVRTNFTTVVERSLNDALNSPTLDETRVRVLLESIPEQLAGGPATLVYSRFLPDMHRYFFGDFRATVQDRLRESLDSIPTGDRVCLIAHSMGSIVALDTLLGNTRDVDTLITIGSPLGISVVQEHLKITPSTKDKLGSKIGQWYNLYDRLDIVALDSDLQDDFDPLPILDVRVRNEFVTKDGERNHHKSYGYLRSPELGEIVRNLA